MTSKQLFFLIAFLLVAIVGYNSVFIVKQYEQALKFRLGEVVSHDVDENENPVYSYEPGIHFKVPFINNVKYFEKRIVNLDVRATEYIVANKEKLLVDFYAKWRIVDVKKFYTTMSGGNVAIANERLFNIINDGLKGQFSQYPVNNLVSGQRLNPDGEVISDEKVRVKILSEIIDEANAEASKYGIEIVDIRVKRIDFPPTISQAVYEDMRTERGREATDHRSRGKEESEKLRADADRKRTITLADGYRDAETIRGQGDAEAAAIYADAYNQDPEFYTFYRSLTAYRNTFASGNDMIIIDPNSDYFNYFKNVRPHK